jgi:hypothetical protein
MGDLVACSCAAGITFDVLDGQNLGTPLGVFSGVGDLGEDIASRSPDHNAASHDRD